MASKRRAETEQNRIKNKGSESNFVVSELRKNNTLASLKNIECQAKSLKLQVVVTG